MVRCRKLSFDRSMSATATLGSDISILVIRGTYFIFGICSAGFDTGAFPSFRRRPTTTVVWRVFLCWSWCVFFRAHVHILQKGLVSMIFRRTERQDITDREKLRFLHHRSDGSHSRPIHAVDRSTASHQTGRLELFARLQEAWSIRVF